MMITKEKTASIVAEFGKEFGASEKDSGCAAVQVAILTERINNLKEHFGSHKHDYSSNRGLLKMIGRRRRLLKYVSTENEDNYKSLIKKLGLRK
ncbi:30S ribosomal protein S15 [Halobacteriovorax vibrionivorans]|uniref:Small ribosomal subunit protein uS15 n=2 Tax=Halobacteriovoraceae TaxID=1652132 RepID=A0ABY0IHZ8_9BACT|nr:30S ribosomal protein S15 [Halobacteriovorax vibrionivorans]TGD47535.1 30S ribosomal protein S15 [Halobacteriovorax sp. Y22]